MEPAFQRGDLLFLTNYESDPIRVGEILVFKVRPIFLYSYLQISGRDIPIVHRVMKVHQRFGFRSLGLRALTHQWKLNGAHFFDERR